MRYGKIQKKGKGATGESGTFFAQLASQAFWYY